MRIERRQVGDVTVLDCAGEWDAAQTPEILDELNAILDEGARKLVFDCWKLKFISSAPLSCLIAVHQRLSGMEGQLVIARPSELFKSTLQTLGMQRIFRIFASEEDALAFLSTAPEKEVSTIRLTEATFAAATSDLDTSIDRGARRFVVNLKGLRFIDSTAIGTLIRLRRRVADLGGELVISEPSHYFLSVSAELGLDKVLRFFEDDETARQHLSR